MKMREDDLSSFYQGVKAVLKAKAQQLQGIHGAVAQQIDVPSKYTKAIETALGASMQHVIVSDEAAARQAIQFLKTKKLGRATFLPLNVIKAKTLDPRVVQTAQQMTGFVTLASEAVKVDTTYKAIIDNLLGRTLIVDGLKNANDMARAIQYQTRIVTLEGDVVNPGGSMTGGGTQQRQSLLGQKDELQQLQAQLEIYLEKTKQLELFCQNQKSQQDTLSEQYVTAQQDFNMYKQALHDLSLEHDRYREIEQRLKNEHEEFEFEKNDGYQSDKSEATLKDKQARQVEIAEQLEQMEQQIKAMTEQRKVSQAQASQLQQQLHQYKSDLAVVVERIKTQQQQLKRMEKEQQQIDAQQQKLTDQLALINSDEVNDRSTLEKIQAQITKYQDAKTRHLEQQRQLRQQRQDIEDLIESNEQALESIHQKLLEIENQYQNIKSAQSRLDVLIDQALKHLNEKYHMTFEHAKSSYSLADANIDALRQKVKLTQMSIDELGHVNLNAIEQYEEVSARYTFLSEQRNDLREAKATLEQIIQEMDAEVAERFSITTLKEKYEVSKSTIIKALELLEHDGIIYQAQGSGIYVRNARNDNHINVFKTNGFSKSLNEHQLTSKVLKLEEITDIPETVMQELNLSKSDSVYYLERLRYVDGNVLCIEYSYYNKEIVKYLNTEITEGSIFDYLEQNMQVKVGFSDIYFNADQLNTNEAHLLKLEPNDPCLRYHQTFHTTTGIPFDASDIVFHYKNAHFYIPSKR
ncbi:UTRA domain-containing protein [Staphylococcus pseudintermedius]|nr:UTRA domain-containing protein [Staphylococcus pseudintermedius]